MKWFNVLKIVGPAILAVVPGAQAFIPLLIAGMEVAERSQQPGAEKRVIARDAVRIGAEAAQTAGADIEPVEAVKVYDSTVDTVVLAVNLVSKLTKDDDITE